MEKTKKTAQQRREENRRKNAEKIIAATGWTEEQAMDAILKAYKRGLSSTSYVAYECWKMDEEKFDAFIAALKLKNRCLSVNETQTPLERMCIVTGWDEERAQKDLERAVMADMSEDTYVYYSCWDLTLYEVKELKAILVQLEERNLIEEEWYFNVVCEKCGKDRETIAADIERYAERGISKQQYIEKEFYIKNEEDREKLIEKAEKTSEGIRERWHENIMKLTLNTGWSMGKVHLEVMKAKLNCECSYQDYYQFELYKRTPEEQRAFVTDGMFNRMRIVCNTPKNGGNYTGNKALFNATFSDCIKRVWFTNEDLTWEKFVEYTDSVDVLLVKPIQSTKGKGIQKVVFDGTNKREIYEQLINMPRSIIEEYIVQHPELMKFSDKSVNTVRITTLNYKGECKYIYSLFRMGRGKVVDNLSSGGIGSAVDMKTGEVITAAIDLDKNMYERHPQTGKQIKGFIIPHWDKILETCEKIYNRIPQVNLIGWDFAITPDGVELIEGNGGAAYAAAQMPLIPYGIGLRDVMVEPYLESIDIYKGK